MRDTIGQADFHLVEGEDGVVSGEDQEILGNQAGKSFFVLSFAMIMFYFKMQGKKTQHLKMIETPQTLTEKDKCLNKKSREMSVISISLFLLWDVLLLQKV